MRRDQAEDSGADLTLGNKGPCSNCLEPAQHCCRRCSGVHYCSQKCQTIDWKFHKHLCAEFRDLKDRPSTNHVLAVFFPEYGSKAQLVWIAKKEEIVDVDSISKSLEPLVWLQVGNVRGVARQTTTMGERRQKKKELDKIMGLEEDKSAIKCIVYLLLRKDNIMDGSKPNTSIGTVTKGRTPFSWRGPILAILTKGGIPPQGNKSVAERFEESYVVKHGDMDLIDYRDLIDFFADYGSWTPELDDFAPHSLWWESPILRREIEHQQRIWVVRVSCDAEYKLTGFKYTPLTSPPTHPGWAFLQPLPITVKFGLPLIMRRLPALDSYKAEAEATNNINTGPNFLHLNPEAEGSMWLTVPEQAPHGSVMIMRYDKKNLHVNHLYAMLAYLNEVVRPAMEEAFMGKREKGEVLEMIHPSRFDWYFKRMRKERVLLEGAPDLFDLPSSESTRDVVDDRLEGPMQGLQITPQADNEENIKGDSRGIMDQDTMEDPKEVLKETLEKPNVKKLQKSFKENVKESSKESSKEDHKGEHKENHKEELKEDSEKSSKEDKEKDVGQVLKESTN